MKLAAVVGATRGIGLASAHRLASDGFKLLLLGRNTELLNNVARQISDINNVLLPDCIPIDSSDPKLVKDAFQWIYKAHAGLDVLVYNAGIFEASPIGMVSSEQIRRVFKIGRAHV